MHTENDKTDAATALYEAAKRTQQRRSILDGPVTNRGLLLVASYLAEAIRCVTSENPYAAERVASDLVNLEDDLTLAAAHDEAMRADSQRAWLDRE